MSNVLKRKVFAQSAVASHYVHRSSFNLADATVFEYVNVINMFN